MSGSNIIKHMDLTTENWDLIIKRLGFHNKKQAPKEHMTAGSPGWTTQALATFNSNPFEWCQAMAAMAGKGGWGSQIDEMDPGSEFRMLPIFLAPLAVSLAFVDVDVINVIPLFFFFAWLASYSHVLPWPPPYSWLCQLYPLVIKHGNFENPPFLNSPIKFIQTSPVKGAFPMIFPWSHGMRPLRADWSRWPTMLRSPSQDSQGQIGGSHPWRISGFHQPKWEHNQETQETTWLFWGKPTWKYSSKIWLFWGTFFFETQISILRVARYEKMPEGCRICWWFLVVTACTSFTFFHCFWT